MRLFQLIIEEDFKQIKSESKLSAFKASLLSELNLEIDQAKKILENSGAQLLKESKDYQTLVKYHSLYKNLGFNVKISQQAEKIQENNFPELLQPVSNAFGQITNQKVNLFLEGSLEAENLREKNKTANKKPEATKAVTKTQIVTAPAPKETSKPSEHKLVAQVELPKLAATTKASQSEKNHALEKILLKSMLEAKVYAKISRAKTPLIEICASITITLALALMLVVGAGYMQQKFNQADISVRLTDALLAMALLDQQNSSSEQKNFAIKEFVSFQGEKIYDDRAIEAKFVLNGRKPMAMLINLSTLPPSVNESNQGTTPWIRRIRIQNFAIKYLADGSFIAKGLAKVFITDGTELRQTVAPATVTGKISNEDSSIIAKVQLESGYEEMPDERNTLIEKQSDGSYKIFVEADVVAQAAI